MQLLIMTVSEVFNLMIKLLLVPATNAASKRSGSALRRRKTCLPTIFYESIQVS